TKRATIIAEDEGDVGSGSWSPDGKRLAFVLNRASEGSAELRVHEPDASLTTALLAWEGWICSLLWSPDGERLAFSGAVEKPGQHSFSCKSEVYTINAGGGGITKLTSHGGNISGLSWSPTDENTLAYVLYSDMDQFGGINGDLYLIDPTVPDSQPAALLKNIFYLGCPDWSPDGQYLAIGTYESGLLIDMRTLVQRPISGGAMKWSPDSTALLFETIGGGVSMVAMRRIRWIDIESPYSEHHAAEDFLHGKRFWQTNADWAPDMEEIAFAGLLNAPDPAP
ncbi:MAG: PD40 domain-containing protein, partial [Anaerolineae bacterium]|nr:PD40 domain-containing protein [Anaerolineae bacterium]